MKWISQESGILSAPYSIHRETRGFSVWYKKGQKYGVLARELVTLEKAKEYAEAHRAKEASLLKSLDAVDAK